MVSQSLPEARADFLSSIDRERLEEICVRRRIRRIALFGSALRSDFGPDSDIDLLVDFEPDAIIGLDIVDTEAELSALFGGRRIDLVREKYLNKRLRPEVLRSARDLRAA